MFRLEAMRYIRDDGRVAYSCGIGFRMNKMTYETKAYALDREVLYGDGDDALALFQGITRDRVKDRFGGYYPDFISNFHASNIVDYILENKNKVMFDTDKHEIMLVRSVWLNGFNHGMSFGKGEDINVNLYDKKVAEPAIFYFKYSDKFLKFLL